MICFNMSAIGYRGLLYRVSQNLVEVSKINQILYTARCEGLIAEDSESYNAQVNPGDKTSAFLMKLFSDLEEQGNLGIDNLEVLRDLLKEVKEWSLIDKVDRLEKQRKDFVALLDTIICKLDQLDDLHELTSSCYHHISEDVKGEVGDVRAMFSELEKNNRLGFGRLGVLKKILKDTGAQDLLDEVTKFEKKRKAEEAAERRRDQATEAVKTVIVAPTAGLYSTIKHTGEQLIGALKICCKFSTVSGISLAVGSGIILRQGSRASLREFVDAFKEAVLPAATELRALSESSLCFTVQADNSTAVKELWERYQDGTLQRNLEKFLVTDDIRQLASGEEVILSVYVDEQEFNDACLSLIMADKQGAASSSRTPKEGIPERSGLKRLEPTDTSGLGSDDRRGRKIGDLERPGKRRRRNSDSEMYCKAPGEHTREREKREQFLADEKYAFVQRYLETVHETHSITTETSDSGVKTHGAPFELEMEDICATDDSQRLCLRHLSKDATDNLRGRIEGDAVAAGRILQSFGISGHIHLAGHIFYLFPDTPVKLLKAVFEALELFDLVEMLEKAAKHSISRSLRSVLTLDEIEKLKSMASRPTSFHGKAAVLIFTDNEQDGSVRKIHHFFKNLNLNNAVSVVNHGTFSEFGIEKRSIDVRWHEAKKEVRWLMNSIQVEPKDPKDPTETFSKINQLMNQLQMQWLTLEQLEKEKRELGEIAESKLTLTNTVIDKWIQCQGDFSFFAVFDLSGLDVFPDLITKLACEIPNKPKFVVTGQAIKTAISEALQVTVEVPMRLFIILLLGILEKRWQSLDLVSMMDELKRTVHEKKTASSDRHWTTIGNITITDTLSSLVRFKREEELS